jgi:hypothetical protein
MLRQTVIRKIQQLVEQTSLSEADFEYTSGRVRGNETSWVAAARIIAELPASAGRAAFSTKYRPIPEFYLTYLASASEGSIDVRCSPSPRSSLKEDSFTIRWTDDSVVKAAYDWLNHLAAEVGAHGMLRAEQDSLAALQSEVEGRLTALEEAAGEKIPEERIPAAELSAILGRIGDIERELQVRIAQQGLDDATRDKKISDLTSEVEKLRFAVAVYTRRGLAMTLLRLILKFAGSAGDVAALVGVGVKLFGP